jgi:hypothetical protein
VVEVGVEGRDHPRVVVGELEDRPVAHHLPVLVAEGRVADLADLEPEHVVREDAIGRREGLAAAEIPFPQRRLVPDAGPLPDRLMLGNRIAKMIRPAPALPLHEVGSKLSLCLVEGGLDDAVAHAGSPRSFGDCGYLSGGAPPRPAVIAAARSTSIGRAPCIAAGPKRGAGP